MRATEPTRLRVLQEQPTDENVGRYCWQCLVPGEVYIPSRTGRTRTDLLHALAADARAYFGDGERLEHGPLEAWSDEDYPNLYASRQEFYIRPAAHWQEKHQGRPAT